MTIVQGQQSWRGLFPNAATPRLAARSGTISLHGLPREAWAAEPHDSPLTATARAVTRVLLLTVLSVLLLAPPAAVLLYAARQLGGPLQAMRTQVVPASPARGTAGFNETPVAHTVTLRPAHH